MMTNRTSDDGQVLLQWATGFQTAQIIYVAAKLGLADLLANGPREIDDLAQDTGTHAPSLARFLRVLVGLGVLAQGADGSLSLTPLGAGLKTGAHGSVRD